MPLLQIDAIETLLPTLMEGKDVEEVFVGLHDRSSVTATLQSDITSVAELRSLFDVVISEYPEAKKRLASDSSIAHDVDFQQAV